MISPALILPGGNLNVRHSLHKTSDLNAARALENGIDHILTYEGNPKELLQSILCDRSCNKVDAFSHFKTSMFQSNLSRETTYFIIVSCLKDLHRTGYDLSIFKVTGNFLATWVERMYGKKISIQESYVNEMKVRRKQVVFEHPLYYIFAKVHIKLEKLKGIYWDQSKFTNM